MRDLVALDVERRESLLHKLFEVHASTACSKSTSSPRSSAETARCNPLDSISRQIPPLMTPCCSWLISSANKASVLAIRRACSSHAYTRLALVCVGLPVVFMRSFFLAALAASSHEGSDSRRPAS